MGPIDQSSRMSAAEFAKALGDSGLIPPDEIHRTLDTQCGGTAILNAGDLAAQLVHAGKITSFQAKAVLEERVDQLLIGNYEVLELLGAGAMGTVYKARHRRMKRIVALKMLSHALAKPAFIQRFQREVETLAQLTHPNVIMAFDADEAEAGHFLVMEFVDGRDLATIVRQNGKMSVANAVEAIEQAGRGLEYAHAKNVVHRDIKPANIMWDVSGVVKVADLGLARLASAQDVVAMTALTQAGSIVGTVDYMAPEQAVDSSTIDQRADVYSLGCTLHFLLTAEPPYQGNSVMAVLLKHRDGPIPKLRNLRPDAPVELETLLCGMLAKKPEARVASMTEVVQALGQIKAALARAEGAPVAADRRIADLTVVLVEPSRAQAGIIRRYLQELGIDKIHNAGSGLQAMELAKQHTAEVLVCSLHLGDMTGMQLARRLRADTACSAMGFVLTTSGSESEDLTDLRTMPHTVLMPKPFDVKKLAASLAQASGRSVGS